jgi:mRNA interferase MazF
MIIRGDIVLAKLNTVRGSEQGGIRPALIIQNNEHNKYSPTTIIAPLTSKIYSKDYPTNVLVKSQESGLDKDSIILLNQIRVIDKSRVLKRIGELSFDLMKKVDSAIKVSLDLN